MNARWLFPRTGRPFALIAMVTLSALAASLALTSDTLAATTPWPSAQITHNLVYDWHPQVSADWVVWQADDGHDWEILAFDLQSGTIRQLTDDLFDDTDPQLDGDRVVWTSTETGEAALVLHDLTTSTTRSVPETFGPQGSPSIAGGWIAYQGGEGAGAEIYLYDIAGNSTRRLTTDSVEQANPQIDGRHVVYETHPGADQSEVFLYDIGSGETKRLSPAGGAAVLPRVSAGMVTWNEARGGHQVAVLYDPETATRTELGEGFFYPMPQIGGHYAVWRESATPTAGGVEAQIVLYDLVAKTKLVFAGKEAVLQADGRLLAYGDPDHFGAIVLYDTDTGERQTFRQNYRNYTLFVLAGGWLVWDSYTHTNEARDTFEIMIAGTDLPPMPPAPTPPAVVFADIGGSPYEEAVAELGRWGYVRGYPAGHGLEFRPTSTVMRGQFAVMLGNVGEFWPRAIAFPYTDLWQNLGEDSSDAYMKTIHIIMQSAAALYDKGVMSGTTPTTFSPWAKLSRAQLLTAAARTARLTMSGSADPPAGFRGSLGGFSPTHGSNGRYAEFHGLTDGLVGFGPGWDPWAPATRGEVAQVLWNLQGLLEPQ